MENIRITSLQQESDEELMLGVKQGRLHNLGELFERHHVKLFNFFLRFCGNRHWSEDMVQNTFMRVLKYAASYHDSGVCLAWIFNIARNVALDYMKLEAAQPPNPYRSGNEDDEPRNDPAYLEELRQGDRRLQEALLQLPAEKRQLVLLSKLNRISLVDLAAMYECSPGTVKVRIHRALEELRGYYGDIPSLNHSLQED